MIIFIVVYVFDLLILSVLNTSKRVKEKWYNYNEFSFVNDSIIAKTLVVVPIIRANNPKMQIKPFFTIIIVRSVVDFPFKNTSVSIKAGNAKPSVDKQNAPNKEMNKSNFGIATANRTVKKYVIYLN